MERLINKRIILFIVSLLFFYVEGSVLSLFIQTGDKGPLYLGITMIACATFIWLSAVFNIRFFYFFALIILTAVCGYLLFMTIVMALFFGRTIHWVLLIPTFLNLAILGYLFHQNTILFHGSPAGAAITLRRSGRRTGRGRKGGA